MGSNTAEAKKEGILLGIEGIFSPFSAFSSPASSVPSPLSLVCSSLSSFLHLLGALSLYFRVVFYAGPNVLYAARLVLSDFRCALRFSPCFSFFLNVLHFDDLVPPRLNFVIWLKWIRIWRIWARFTAGSIHLGYFRGYPVQKSQFSGRDLWNPIGSMIWQ